MVMATLMAFLEDPAFLHTTQALHLDYASRDEIAKEAKRLLIRHFPAPPPPVVQGLHEDPDEPEVVEASLPEGSCSDGEESVKWSDCLKPKKVEIPRATSTSTLDLIETAMSGFETSGERPKSLEKVLKARCNLSCTYSFYLNIFTFSNTTVFQVYKALMSVPPTSCEAERCAKHLNFENSKDNTYVL